MRDEARFQSQPGPRRVVQAGTGRVLRAHTAREAFDEVVTTNLAFAWHDMEGIVVIRPVVGWSDPDDLLNQQADAFQLINASLK